MFKNYTVIFLAFFTISLSAQDYFLKKYQPFNSAIPSPEAFLGYPIGSQHTRHDQIVAYLKELARISDMASIYEYGKTHEGRKLVILTISSSQNLQNLEQIKQQHLAFVDTNSGASNYDQVPIFINLGYNVHGNEPSSSEAAMLSAYTLLASNHPEIRKYRSDAVIFIDPTINPDGRDRHTQWANSYKGNPLVSDPQDAEHSEYWPQGRTNHYWFDLNRDWLLGINPESRGKLNWYHEWYPNVVTDFHEMGTNSTYFFEPMKPIGSKDPIMPKENYTDLNDIFGAYFSKALDSIGSLYFTKEAFDGTYPGYGSSYPDLQGGLALLFEQASSRGHVQKTPYGKITFPFTIRNQYTSSMTTVKAAVENKALLRKYQQDFFKSALSNASKKRIRAYTFEDKFDKNRLKAFIDKLLLHRIKVYKTNDENKYVVPTNQPQYRMVQTVFETYKEYRDSVFYDASAWSVANFYNVKYRAVSSNVPTTGEVTSTEDLVKVSPVSRSSYAYIIDYDDYNASAVLYYLQHKGVNVAAAYKPFSIQTSTISKKFNYGTLVVPVSKQKLSPEKVYQALTEAQKRYKVPMYSVASGFSLSGIDLGSRYVQFVQKPKAAMVIGNGVRSYEAGEVWHLLDTRVHMPITKIPMRNFSRSDLDRYNTLVLVSGNYNQLDSNQQKRIKDWIAKGNTLITIGSASRWAINTKIVNEKLTKAKKKDSLKAVSRKPYVDAPENLGKESVGGAIFKVDLDVTHPLGFGYHDTSIPVYKNNTIWLAPSKNEYATVAKYSADPHIDGFITDRNLNEFMKPSASLIVSPVGRGRAVLFADNPNFRGSWYGTNRLFLNALFFGNEIRVPR
ncbi:zinc carboxypeptidase [Leptobacterium flavescens]|uniref:Zinc carboxypeptidase n=1 Tax=Leptobacterium flavescens TaxID=472055 RepID=A0A6P0UGQ3_9FLAO|nr:M14 metallopeptidase family protein [Leptobacterium flavescens]NER12197.1 zinc carboxypeptidase [Leptobacterium flavescens]